MVAGLIQFIGGMVVGICVTVIGFVVADGRDDRNYERD
jgi:hypothetical protein